MVEKKGPAKGFFAKIGLPVTKSYIYPIGRNRLLAAGALIGLVGTLVLAADLVFRTGGLVSSGPLSSSHASFEGDCASCHTHFEPMNDEKCSVCHEAYDADVGDYSFDAHYVYRSEDLTRAFGRDGELPCFGCHSEHRGRDANMAAVADARCQRCHDIGSFREHPPFEFAARSRPDNAGIVFTHVRHVKRIMERDELVSVEKACLQCHEPRHDGKNFQPIDFDAQCSACHLGRGSESAELPVSGPGPIAQEARGGIRLELGVETLQAIRSRQGPGERWALYESPREFRAGGGRIAKTRLVHEDPWILHNLNRARSAIYPSLGLAALIKASPEIPARESRVLYQEALETLREYSEGLRGASDRGIVRELERIDRMLEEVEDKLDDRDTPLDGTEFLLAEIEDPKLSAEQIDEILGFAEDVAQPCLQCHRLRKGAIARVQKDQRVLDRAEFDHRPHILQRRCWDCHASIPFLDHLDDPDRLESERDQAAIQNLPTLVACQQCHTPELVTSRCSSCHAFHPGESIHSRLLLSTE